MKRTIKVFGSFREADEAESDYYASLTPEQRVELLLELVARYRESLGESAERLERVHRVTELSRG